MNIDIYEKKALFEHRFWLQILGDHGRFILNALSAEEIQDTKRAEWFINVFDRLLVEAHKDLSGISLMQVTREAYHHAIQLRAFKLHLLRRHLMGKVKIQISPTFLNHMLNELEEYVNVLCLLLSVQVPIFHPIHHHILWLSDAVGHAAGIIADLDEIEKDLIEKSTEFKKNFEALYEKAIEVSGYMRTNLYDFPALSRFNHQAEITMTPFKEFLEDLAELKLSNQILGTLLPLMADHMSREECYYLLKLSESSDTEVICCDPAKPRIES